ncbi:HD domain-containing protein [Enterococcus gallinarum]|nr:HD domain-containing protein [Enterococcus gallinarum]
MTLSAKQEMSQWRFLMVNPQLMHYLETTIIPQYKQFDTSHSPEHVYQVLENSIEIAAPLSVDLDIVSTVAVFHDLGLLKGRKNHERASRSMVESDAFLADYFTKEQRKIIGEAVEDHRASLSYEPRSIYGKIISEADRDLDFYRILERTIYFAIEKRVFLILIIFAKRHLNTFSKNTVPTIT